MVTGSCVARQLWLSQVLRFDGSLRDELDWSYAMKMRRLDLVSLLRRYGHEVILASVLTAVGLGALAVSALNPS